MKTVRSVTLACLMSACAGMGHAQVTLQEARNIAPLALQNGDIVLASQLAQGLLQASPDDMTGLIVQASVLQRMGQHKKAIKMARRAVRLSDTKHEKFTTAMIMARSQFQLKAYERAKFWLRVASQNTSRPQQDRDIATSYGQVRAASPWSTSLQFNISPSDNVNNGTKETTASIDGCIFGGICDTIDLNNSEPLSGLIFQLAGRATYTLSESKTHRRSAGVDLTHQHVELVGSDRKNSPYRGSDFNYTYLGGNLSDTRLVGTKGVNVTTNLSFGRGWIKRPSISGNEVTARPVTETDTTRFSMSARKVLTPKRRITVGYGLTLSEDHDDSTRSSKGVSLRFADEHVLKNRDRLTWSLNVRRTNSASLSSASQSSNLTLSYAPSKRIQGISANFSATMGWRQNQRSNGLFGSRRKDHSLTLRGSFTAHDVSFYGFSPVAIVELNKTNSNQELYRSQSAQMRLNFVTSF